MEQRGVFLQYLEWELSIADERKTPEVARRGLLREGQEGATRSLGEEEGEEKKTRERRADGFSRACPAAGLVVDVTFPDRDEPPRASLIDKRPRLGGVRDLVAAAQ